MGYRIVETQESVRVALYLVARDRGIVVYTEPELIDDDDYAVGVFDSLKEAWDRGDYYEVQYVELEPRTGRVLRVLESIGGMAGYGGSEAAACAAAHDFFSLPPEELDLLRRKAGCDYAAMMRTTSPKVGVKFDLDGTGDEDDAEEGVYDPDAPAYDEGEEDTSDTPQDDDYFIHAARRGGYYATQHGKVVMNFRGTEDDVERVIWQHMEASQFWPNVWRVGERGDVDIVILKPPKAVKFDLDGLSRASGRGTLPSWARPSRRR